MLDRPRLPSMSSEKSATLPLGPLAPAFDYLGDAAQRTVLFWDVMRQRGNQYREHIAKTAPHVLNYDVEVIIDGRRLDRPVNYVLVRVVPPKDIAIDPTRRPFVVVDPRAGHGPGIGGFKADSEIGVAFKAGHPCYFVGFLPEPVSSADSFTLAWPVLEWTNVALKQSGASGRRKARCRYRYLRRPFVSNSSCSSLTLRLRLKRSPQCSPTTSNCGKSGSS